MITERHFIEEDGWEREPLRQGRNRGQRLQKALVGALCNAGAPKEC